MQSREKAAYQEGTVSIIANTGLFFLKLWAGVASGSLALVADAWHTLSDSISSIIVIVGTKLATKKADKEHPFGHGRWEQIAAFFIAFLLGIIAYSFLTDSIDRFQNKEEANFGTIAIVVTIISIVVKEALAQYAFILGKKTDNASIKADGWHHRTDALSSIVVLAGIFLEDYFWWIDAVLGLIIALMLFYATYEIVKEAISKLLGATPSDMLINDITELISETVADAQPHHFHIHNYGDHRELTFHIKLDRNMTIEQGHAIAEKIENKILEKLNIESTIHIDPDNVNIKEKH